MKATVSILSVVALLASVGTVTADHHENPQLSPEQKLLERFVGEWVYHGTQTDAEGAENLFGPAGDFSGRFTNRLFMDGRFMVTEGVEKNPGGILKRYHVTAYDAEKKVYIDTTFNSDGSRQVATETMKGNTRSVEMTLTSRKGKKILVRAKYEYSKGFSSFVSTWQMSVDNGASWHHWAKYSGTKLGK